MKFGAKHISRESSSDQDLIVYDGFDGDDDLLLSQVAGDGDPDFYRSVRLTTRSARRPTSGRAEQFFRDN